MKSLVLALIIGLCLAGITETIFGQPRQTREKMENEEKGINRLKFMKEIFPDIIEYMEEEDIKENDFFKQWMFHNGKDFIDEATEEELKEWKEKLMNDEKLKSEWYQKIFEQKYYM